MGFWIFEKVDVDVLTVEKKLDVGSLHVDGVDGLLGSARAT